MKFKPTVVCVTGAVICASAAIVSRTLDLSTVDTVLVRVMAAMILGCFLVQIGYVRSLHVEKQEAQNRTPPIEHRE